MKIVVIGGTGLIGSKTVALLRGAGHDVLAAAPNTGADTVTGEACDITGQYAERTEEVACVMRPWPTFSVR